MRRRRKLRRRSVDTVGIETRHVNWVLDADIRGSFDTLDHTWLVRFLEHRVADRRVVRLIQKWLRAGVRNGPSLSAFRDAVTRLWRAVLMRRSQTALISWRMRRYAARWLPIPRICHPYPNQRLALLTHGRSRMR